jgi:hypothetical protein
MAHPNDDRPLGDEIPPGGPLGSLEADEQSMRKGKGRMLAGIALAVAAAIVALALYLASGGESAYGSFGKQINGLDREHFAGFWGCVMQGYDLRRLKSDQDLRDQLHERAARGRARFGAYVRDDCLPRLAKLEPELAAVASPQDEELAQPLRDMRESVGRLRGSFSDYIAHLDGLDEDPYERDAAADPVGRIARAWFDYRVALGALNAHLRDKLDR